MSDLFKEFIKLHKEKSYQKATKEQLIEAIKDSAENKNLSKCELIAINFKLDEAIYYHCSDEKLKEMIESLNSL